MCVAPQDHVSLVVEQIAVARFALPYLPLDVLERLEAALETLPDLHEALELHVQIALGNGGGPGAGCSPLHWHGILPSSTEPRAHKAGQFSQWCHA